MQELELMDETSSLVEGTQTPVHTEVKEPGKEPLHGSLLTDPGTFAGHLESMSDAPGWLKERKAQAWETFVSLPMPRRKDEAWRFSRTRALSLEGYRFESQRSPSSDNFRALLTAPRFVDDFAGRLIFADDHEIGRSAMADELRARGVIFTSLKEALRRHDDRIQEHLLAHLPELGSQKFEALHTAFLSNGTFLYVPRGVEIALPFVVRHWATDDGSAVFPHTIVVTEENTRVNLVEIFGSADSATRHFVCGAASIIAGKGSQVSYNAVQDWNLKTLSFHLNSVVAGQDSNVKTVMLNLGSHMTRNEQHTRIVGAGSSVENFSLSVATGSQQFDQRTLQTHSAPNARSNLLYKNVLLDDARTVFSGLIRVDPNAQQTDAYQTNRNLLLSESAEANSLPGLEILADDVKCSHGATTGRLDPEHLFYLQTRGIPKRLAQQLLFFGFFEEIIGKLDNEELREKLGRLIQRKFHN